MHEEKNALELGKDNFMSIWTYVKKCCVCLRALYLGARRTPERE